MAVALTPRDHTGVELLKKKQPGGDTLQEVPHPNVGLPQVHRLVKQREGELGVLQVHAQEILGIVDLQLRKRLHSIDCRGQTTAERGWAKCMDLWEIPRHDVVG